MFSFSSLAAAVVGVVALGIDLITAALTQGAVPHFATVFTVADIIGLICGVIAKRSLIGKIGLHLSWVPLAVALIVLGAANPDLSALLIRNVLGVLIGIATGLVQIVTLVFA